MPNHILLAHGGGGELTHALVRDHVLPRLGNTLLNPLLDSAILDIKAGRLCMTTDASVVTPLFFPGGDIGRLAVSGTVNDLAVMGADPLSLSLSLIMEEGLTFETLDRVLDSVAATAREAGVPVATGDTKVIERRHASGSEHPAGLILSTAGIGRLPEGVELAPSRIAPGDYLLVTGRLAEHGLAVMAAREGLGIDTDLRSDVQPLSGLTRKILQHHGPAVRFMRDPTRGGLAGVLADIAESTGNTVEVAERALPLSGAARHTAELLGLDPLTVANEGKLVIACAPGEAEALLRTLRAHPQGEHAAVIGKVTGAKPPLVELITAAGGRRIVQRPYGEDLPRIC